MKRLYNKQEHYTEHGKKLAGEVNDAIEPLARKWMEAGFTTREVEEIIANTARCACIFMRFMVKSEAEDAKDLAESQST